jgi:riboflavin kinase/FMN adenylyltransferase
MDSYSVALGIFDGVHLGHQYVINRALSYKERGLKTAVFTFSVEDMKFKQGRELHYIIDNQSKLDIVTAMGVDTILCPNFNSVHNLSGEDFARDILHGELHTKVVVCGKKFRFGKGASCGTEDLLNLGEKYGFQVEIVEPILSEGGLVSSSNIRELIKDGDIKTANKLLGREYFISKEVVHGNALGRTIGIPTINQHFADRQVVPKFGVYSSITVVNGIEYKSMTNVGVKPTVTDANTPLAETYIIGYHGDLYGKTLKVKLLDYIRPEKKFSSIEELKTAIQTDIQHCL